MNQLFFSAVAAVFIFAASLCYGQTATNAGSKKPLANQTVSAAKSSPAYAELLLRRTERTAELEELLLDYTEEYPKVKEIRFELSLIQKETDKVLTVNQAEASRLTLALGKMLVRKIELEVVLWNLRIQYKDDQADVKRARRKIEVYEKAIKEILP